MRRLALTATLAVLAAQAPALAEWTPEAESCATDPDPVAVAAACTVAINSRKLDRDELAKTHSNRAWALRQLSRNAEARRDLLMAIKLDAEGGLPVAWNLLGMVEMAEGNLELAEGHFLKALERLEARGEADLTSGAGTLVDATGNLARLYDRMGEAEKAEEWAKRAYRVAPDIGWMQEIYRKYGLR